MLSLPSQFDQSQFLERAVLFVTDYLEATRTLLQIATLLREQSRVACIFLIGVSQQQDQLKARILDAGFPVLGPLPLQDAGIEEEIRNPFQRRRLERVRHAMQCTEILNRARPLVIVSETGKAYHLLVCAARRGIPTLLVDWVPVAPEEARLLHKVDVRWRMAQYPLLGQVRYRIHRFLRYLGGSPRGGRAKLPVQKIAVAGPYYRNAYLRAGVAANKVVVTGNAQCDEMHRCARLSDHELGWIRRRLGLPSERPFFLYASENTNRFVMLEKNSAHRAHDTILKAMRCASPNTPRVVRLHPRQGRSDAELIQSLDRDAMIVRDDPPLGELIAACAGVVTVISSCLLWSIGIDRPTISAFLWEGIEELRSFRDVPGVERVDSFEELVRALHNNLESAEHQSRWSTARAASRAERLLVDGGAVQRIVKVISDMME